MKKKTAAIPARDSEQETSWLARPGVVTGAADLAAMGNAVKLLVGGPARWYAVGFGQLSLGLQILIPCHRYARVLKGGDAS